MRVSPPATMTVAPAVRASGLIRVPGDKSISHRYAMLAAIANGRTRIRGYSAGLDCQATLACIEALGVAVHREGGVISIDGRGLHGLSPAAAALDAANSGTTMRLLTGMLAGQPFTTVFVGDASLSRRPMGRIIEPLTRMGARISSSGGRAPLTIEGAPLRGIEYAPPIPSAQVKSCVLLAGLFAEGATIVDEPAATRDHTERALETFGVSLERRRGSVRLDPPDNLTALELTVPGDVSGAAFWCALAAGTPGGDLTIETVGLNPTRTAFLPVLQRAGARVTATVTDSSASEPVGTLRIEHADLRSFEIAPDEVPLLIDEIPALAALAAMMPAGRTLTVRGARELRVKESDRIAVLAAGLRRLGSEVEEREDGFVVRSRPLTGGAAVSAAGDHRMAMAFAIAATRASGLVRIEDEAVAVSYPEFASTLSQITGDHR